MRLRSQLFYVFLALLLVAASIVEASKRCKRYRKRNKKKGKGKKSTLTTLHDAPGSGGETPCQRTTGPTLEPKTMDNKTSIGEAFLSSSPHYSHLHLQLLKSDCIIYSKTRRSHLIQTKSSLSLFTVAFPPLSKKFAPYYVAQRNPTGSTPKTCKRILGVPATNR